MVTEPGAVTDRALADALSPTGALRFGATHWPLARCASAAWIALVKSWKYCAPYVSTPFSAFWSSALENEQAGTVPVFS